MFSLTTESVPVFTTSIGASASAPALNIVVPVDIWTKVAPDPEERPALIDPESVISFAVTAPAPVATKLPLPKLMLEPVPDIVSPALLRVASPNVPEAPVRLPVNVPEAPVMLPLKPAALFVE